MHLLLIILAAGIVFWWICVQPELKAREARLARAIHENSP